MYSAKIIADSVSRHGQRLTTMEVVFPRMVLAEFNTHRVFSRNSASSRAIPVEKQLRKIKEQPFVPEYWGANQSGMQAEAELIAEAKDAALDEWLAARDSAVAHVEKLLAIGLHKQLANRILEPFMWHTVIVTATEWSNYFALRANEMAQPEIRKVSELMQAAYEASTPKQLSDDEWHLPLIQAEEYDGVFEKSDDARKISAARCARVSYLTHEGKRDLSADIVLYDRLTSGGHMSPLEHVARPLTKDELSEGEFRGNFRGWMQLRKLVPNEDDYAKVEKI
ncbi:FAD-dependent thymidylate synthase [Candidatus Saccharibacteria bacterium]|nr:FAD-dependent thymidylate synthase [Candidatus Saccharibacteria bacterium]